MQEKNNIVVEKNLRVTVIFYEKECLPVITWNKNHSSKKVLPIHPHSRKHFLELQILKVCGLYESLWHF